VYVEGRPGGGGEEFLGVLLGREQQTDPRFWHDGAGCGVGCGEKGSELTMESGTHGSTGGGEILLARWRDPYFEPCRVPDGDSRE